MVTMYFLSTQEEMAKLKENIEKLKEEGDVVDTEDKV